MSTLIQNKICEICKHKWQISIPALEEIEEYKKEKYCTKCIEAFENKRREEYFANPSNSQQSTNVNFSPNATTELIRINNIIEQLSVLKTILYSEIQGRLYPNENILNAYVDILGAAEYLKKRKEELQ